MRTRRKHRHPVGRIASSRSGELRDEIDVALPDVGEPVTGEPLAPRALRELDPEILRDDDAEQSGHTGEPATAAGEDARTSAGSPGLGAARRALMLGCWSVLGLAVVIVLSVTVPNAFGLRELTVLSGSMEPTIHTGDVVVERQVSPLDVRLGDVVSFKDPEDASILITHRVQSMVVHDDIVSFVTKGDANTGVERWKVSADGTIGKVEYHVWRLGYLLAGVRGRLGRLLLVVVPAVVLGAYELVRIWRPNPREDGTDTHDPVDGESEDAEEASDAAPA
ncbi:MAG: signal peptidase I [Actinomycetota bacterium]